MRRIWQCCLTLAAFGLCAATTAVAQEKLKAPAHAPAASCDAACLHKVCIAVPDKKKTTTYEYSCKEKDVCLHRCVFGGFHFGGLLRGHGCSDSACESSCGSCDQCGRPRTVRVLMKKPVSCETDTTKCIVTHQEACAPACPTSCAPACTTHSAATTIITHPVATAPVRMAPVTMAPVRMAPVTAAPVRMAPAAQPISIQPQVVPQTPPTITIEGVR
ncbi:MAG: hypothetical protein L0Y71_11210 [Gemmataceae bacterium]|nr:hypothetical protein [Gemmataceae bacterium]